MSPGSERGRGRCTWMVTLLLSCARPVLAQPPLCPPVDQWSLGRIPSLASLGPNGSVLSWLQTNAGGTVVEGIALTMLDGTGGTAAGWESGPFVVPESTLTSIPRMIALAGGDFMLTWDRSSSGGPELVQVWAESSGEGIPDRTQLRDSVLTEAGSHLGTADLVASDGGTAFIVAAEPTGGMLRKLGLGTAIVPGWPSAGVALGFERQLGGIASDDSGGTYVADCQAVPCFMPTDDCTTTVKVRRVVADGNFDPRWGASGRVLASALARGQSLLVMPDGAGGCFALWFGRYPYPTAFRLIRLLANGSTAPGWPEEGLPYSSGIANRPGRDSYGRGPQAVVTASSDYLLPAVVSIDIKSAETQIGVLGRSINGTRPAGWSTDVVPLSATVPLLTPSPLIGADSTGRAVVVWTHAGALYANAIETQTGQCLAGWPATGRVLCPGSDLRTEPALLVHEDGTFTVAWSEQRAGEFGVRHARFRIEDGTVATLLSAEVVEHRVYNGWVYAEWRLAGAGEAPVSLVRAVDEAGFVEHTGLERVGVNSLRMRDPVPPGARLLRYVLRSSGEAISDTLDVALNAARLPRLHAATLQRGEALELRLLLDSPEAWAEVALYDIAGRCVARRRLVSLAAGDHALRLQQSGARPGVLLARLRTAGGSTTTRTLVRLER